MKRRLLALSMLTVFALASACQAAGDAKTAATLQQSAVTIHAGGSQGSGVIKTRDGVSYVLTAAHVIDGLKKTREVVDGKTGVTRKVIEFSDPKVVQEQLEGGRSVGRVEMDAEVLRYSDAETGHDLALLRVRKKNFTTASVQFAGPELVPVGTDLLHVGSLLGQVGSNSVTSGVMSQHGRVLFNREFDQTTCIAFPGSSGGGIYHRDGKYVAMVVRGAGEGFNLCVPMRRIGKWAEKVGVGFVLDDAKAVPSDEELAKFPIEDDGR